MRLWKAARAHGRVPERYLVEQSGVFARVVETIMYIALGFVAATLIALLIIPAINARAERLARRRAEALFPMSISELTAEKDHLRAEFAVMQRRIERKAEEALAVKHQTMEELGRRAVRIEALETDVAERDAVVAGLRAELAETRSVLAATEDELANTRATLAGARDTLAAVEDAHSRTLDELTAARSELERTATALAETKTELALTGDRLALRESEFADLDRRHDAALSDLDTKRITISDLETRLTTQTARGDEFERALGERHAELAAERQRLADLAKSLLAEQDRGLFLEQRIRELEGERDDQASEAAALAVRVKHLTEQNEALSAALEERRASGGDDTVALLPGPVAPGELEEALSAAREERARLRKEVKALRQSTGAASEDIRNENAELRRRIAEVADEIMRAAKAGDKNSSGRRKVSR